ncbi:GtrA family protein [uncultured Prochlorococcus sp.]|uniref:GtrA family protein n=1 Tax=uncultured Prochlorococcus sp. TaxID=159733 RepID=UPI00258E7FDD|nr:GtrA family protein [uncultured Prochlorococcus sp.]
MQIFRFIASGLVASGINFLVFNSIYLMFKKIVIASFCGYFIGILFSYTLAKIWVFQNKSRQNFFRFFPAFCLIYFLGGVEMSFVIVFLNQFLNNHKIAWLFGAFIGSLNNYFGSKYFLFRK